MCRMLGEEVPERLGDLRYTTKKPRRASLTKEKRRLSFPRGAQPRKKHPAARLLPGAGERGVVASRLGGGSMRQWETSRPVG